MSHHQGDFDHAKAAAEGFDFCIVKATEGADFNDTKFKRNWRQLGDLGLTRGAYHFGRPGSNPPRVEARFYLETVKLGDEDMRPILDLEAFGQRNLDPPALADWVENWVAEVSDATGKRAIVYTGRFWTDNLPNQTDNFETGLWVPRYSNDMKDPTIPPAWGRYVLWQWAGTSDGKFFPQDLGPVQSKLGPKARLTVAGRKVDQNVGREGVTLSDLVGRAG